MHSIFSTSLIWLAVAGQFDDSSATQNPSISLDCIQVRQGFQVELVAAEPLIADPISIAFGPDGKLWVVEMGDYPSGVDETGQVGGQIRYLEDRNEDGKYDHSTVFIRDLAFPTGVMPWRKGVLVTCAPDIFYAEDTDGDGQADFREVLFSGFVQGNPQHRVNGLRFGLDNWIYCANGDSGGTIKCMKSGLELDIRGRDLRIRPDEGILEPQTGMSQFSQTRDDWGNWFGGNSAFPIWHRVLEDHYLRRNPYVVPPNPCVNLMDPPLHAPLRPVSPVLPRFNELHTAGRFTSACGIEVYRDELLGPAFVGSYFVCEPVHNLVHCERMKPTGVTFSSEPLTDGDRAEFLASSDTWFRPTQVRTGPDGALWVVDMYRLVIEHPDFIPERWHGQLDLHSGRGKGRIYRVYPVSNPPREIVRLDRLETPALVVALRSPNGPQRDMAQQLLLERRDATARPLLERLVLGDAKAASRLHALCTLDGLNMVEPDLLIKAFGDPHPAVRRHAVRICESKLNGSPQLHLPLLDMLNDADPRVRYQLACSLGEWHDRRAGAALAQLLLTDAVDQFLVAAILSSATKFPEEILTALLERGEICAARASVVQNLMQIALEESDETSYTAGLRKIAAPIGSGYGAWQFRIVAGLLDVLERRKGSLPQLYVDSGADLRSAIRSLDSMFAAARRLSVDQRAPLDLRESAVQILGRGLAQQDEDAQILASLLVLQTPSRLQQQAVVALAALQRPDTSKILLDGWSQHSPPVQHAILDVLIMRSEWMIQLLERIESGEIPPAMIGLSHRGPLILHPLPEVRRRAEAAFDRSRNPDRDQVIGRYSVALELPADPRRGEIIFRAKCALCHRPTAKDSQIGPDLHAISNRSPRDLLVDILDPNRTIAMPYVAYAAVTVDGRILTGTMVRETGNAITLIDAQGKEWGLLRDDLEELKTQGRSLMPEGLETEIPDPQDLAHLLAYLAAKPLAEDLLNDEDVARHEQAFQPLAPGVANE